LSTVSPFKTDLPKLNMWDAVPLALEHFHRILLEDKLHFSVLGDRKGNSLHIFLYRSLNVPLSSLVSMKSVSVYSYIVHDYSTASGNFSRHPALK